MYRITFFSVIQHDGTLADLVKVAASSTRNIFPVVRDDGKLVGLIHLDKIRSIMFDQSKHLSVTVQQLMTKPAAIAELNEHLYEVLMKFEQLINGTCRLLTMMMSTWASCPNPPF